MITYSSSKKIFAMLLVVLLCTSGCRKKTKKIVQVSDCQAVPEYVTLPQQSDDAISTLSFFEDDIDAFVLAEEDEMHHAIPGTADPMKTELAWQESNQEEKLLDDSLQVYFGYDGRKPLPNQKVSMDDVGKKAQDWVKKDMTVVCKGHACLWHGTDAYNTSISAERARQVALSLEKKFNIPASRIKVFGVGNEEPVTLENSLEAQAPNRRVEVYAIAA